ncbi:MAG: FeoA domain-containing protein [Longimicrobiales bacterium]
MESISGWPWQQTLATVEKGDVVQIQEILFGMIKDHLQGMGIRKGSVLECLDNRSNEILVRLPNGETEVIGWDHAWFVCVSRTGR